MPAHRRSALVTTRPTRHSKQRAGGQGCPKSSAGGSSDGQLRPTRAWTGCPGRSTQILSPTAAAVPEQQPPAAHPPGNCWGGCTHTELALPSATLSEAQQLHGCTAKPAASHSKETNKQKKVTKQGNSKIQKDSAARTALPRTPRTPPIGSEGAKRSVCHSLPLAPARGHPKKPPRPLGEGQRHGGSPCPALPGSPELRHRGRGLGAGGAEGGGRRQAPHRAAPSGPGASSRRRPREAREARAAPLGPGQVLGVRRPKGWAGGQAAAWGRRLSPNAAQPPGCVRRWHPGALPHLLLPPACGSCQAAESH